MRVLIVDHYPDVAEMMCELLGMLGHECRFALCGADALAVLRTGYFALDLAFIDMELPDVSGYEIAEAMRMIHGRRPVLVATSTWHDHERVQLQAPGFDDFVFKPVDRRALSKIMGLTARKLTTDG